MKKLMKDILVKIKDILKIAKKYLSVAIKYFCKYTGLTYLKSKFMKLPNKYKRWVYGIGFILPWLLGLAYISLPILLKSIRMAFSDKYYFVTGIGWQITGKWNDFTQFKRIFRDEPFHVSQIFHTLEDVALVVPLVVVFALILALLLNQKVKGIAIFRTIFFIPVILLSGNMLMNFERNSLLTVPAIANGEISNFMNEYFPDLFNEVIISAFGKIVLILWLSGVQILIFLAGLQKMDKSTYEAARIDGASMWELFWKITLPALVPLIYLNIIYTTIIYSNLSNNAIVQIINVHSDESRMLGGTLTDEINYGRAYSAALSWILFMIELLVISFYSLVIKLSSRKYN
ncbi:MAG: sugar ABC transporter permease [Candidatus Izemoplasmatales bacterium]|nr:sugar ABC transporter permease [Candidatus Izemoplasmatales bacterium]